MSDSDTRRSGNSGSDSNPPARALSDIVGEALELPAADRDGYLIQACSGNDALLWRARALLASHDRAARAGFLDQPTGRTAEVLPGGPTPAELARQGTRIGPYLLGTCIGAGGFGVVFEATQKEPLERRVAMKLLRAGVATPQVIARFESERRALAMMEHPGIAKVFDAGATEDGIPYFVMEFVEGEPLVAFCDRHRLGLSDRVEILVQVCRALQHAHAKGVIHRDLKPGNILASMQDGRPHAIIIDFGVAKAIEHVSAARTAFTAARQMIGTPEYMSPEQAGAAPDIDTRSDIYSLGVVLYEVLAGVGPYDAGKLRSAAYAELERVLREEEPPRPSTRLSSLVSSTGLQDIAATRRVEPGALVRELRGELDWIVLRCLEKDRARRYETAAALGDDLERYLRDEAVLAKPPSRAYLASKFARRHRTGLAAAAIAMTSLVTGLGASLYGLARARDERALAQGAEEREKVARVHAEREARKAQRATEFLSKILSSADPEVGGRNVTVAASLRNAVAYLDGGELRSEPDVEAVVRHALGMSFNAVNLLADGEAQLRKALELSAGPDSNPIDRASFLGTMAISLWPQEKFAEAEVMLREAVELTRGFTEGQGAKIHSSSLRTLSSVLFYQNKREESQKVFEEARTALLRIVGPDSTEYADLMTSHASSIHSGVHNMQPLKDAIAAHRKRYGDFHPRVARLLVMLGTTNQYMGDMRGMIEPLEEAIAIQQKLYGEDSFQAASVMQLLGEGYFGICGFEEAEYWCARAEVGARVAKVGPASALLARACLILGAVDQMNGDEESAIAHYREAMEAGINGGPEMLPFQRYRGAVELAGALFNAGRAEEAAAITDRLEAARPGVESSLNIAIFMDSVIALTKAYRGEFAQGEPLLLNATEKVRTNRLTRFGLEHSQIVGHAIAFYELWEAAEPGRGHGERADPLRREAAELREAVEKHRSTATSMLGAYRAFRGGSLIPAPVPEAPAPQSGR